MNVEEKFINLKIENRNFINGKFLIPLNNKSIKKNSPIDGRELPELYICEDKDVQIAINAAKECYEKGGWLNKDPKDKKNVLLKLASLVESNLEELALLDTYETGRSFKNYYYDSIPKAIEALRYFSEGIDKIYDHAIPPRMNSFATITREALGVVGLITPWNDPLVVAMWKIAPALLMGNSVVIKPAEQSSYSLLKVASLVKESGLPDGAFNVITGPGEISGKALALNNDVNGIFFTGSTEVGKLIMQYAGQSNLKKVGLECGGKSPFIISKNCNKVKKAAKVLAKNIFYNQGQICSAPSRVLIHYSLKDELLNYLLDESEKYIPSNPLNINSEVGTMINDLQATKVNDYIKSGISSGAKRISPERPKGFDLNNNAILPTIFCDVDLNTKVVKEEIFGPVLVVIDYDEIEEAISLANDTNYGLAASIWTDDLNEAYYVSRKIRAGIVHINCYGDDDNTVPFGGFKESGIGKDKSIFAFDEYSNLKTTWIDFN